ncbi:MAG: response regulator transcription factor [Betaproteobacteria bacterium]|nr:response regulator transcription factor [Betaproteobacteria bacterium]
MPILIATRDPELENRCRRAASAEHELETADSVPAATGRIVARAPSAVLLDSELLERPIERQVAEIVGLSGTARVIVLTPVFAEDEEIALLKAGAKGCCRRGIDPESLQQVLNVTANGGVWVTRSLLPRLVMELRNYVQAQRKPVEKPAMPALSELTQRERDIVRLIVEGASNKEVASALAISERTVKGHLSNVFQKLGVSDRLKLVLYVREGKLAGSASNRKT